MDSKKPLLFDWKRSILDSSRHRTGYHLALKIDSPELEEFWQFSLRFCTAHLPDLAVYCENCGFSASHWSFGGFAKKTSFFLAHPPKLQCSALKPQFSQCTAKSARFSVQNSKENSQNSSRSGLYIFYARETSSLSRFDQKRIISAQTYNTS